MAQIIVLIMLAQASAGTRGVTSLEVGRFLNMDTCRYAAAHAVAIQPLPDTKIGYICVPLTETAGGR